MNPVTICKPVAVSLLLSNVYVKSLAPDVLPVGMPRKTMSPFTFSDGTHVPANNWVVVPQQRMMKDPANYAEPDTFDGFRFVKGNDTTAASNSESRLSHPSWRFPFWGSVKQAWSVISI